MKKKSSKKSVLLIAFTFVASYVIVYFILPRSYWTSYFGMSGPKMTQDILINLLCCIALVELSLFIDRKLNKKIPWTIHPLKRLLVQMFFQILGVIVLIIILASISLIFGEYVTDQSTHVEVKQGLYTVVALMLWSLVISTLNTGNYLLRNWKNATLQAAEFEIKAAQSKQLASEIELQALKLQLDPHFVFNNLSVLSELILKDQQLGYEFTENFWTSNRFKG